jgi:hypothetical protein
VTLTQVGSIGPRFVALVEAARSGYGVVEPPVGFAFVGALLVHFSVAGFLFGYLATSLFLIRLYSMVDQDMEGLMDEVAAGNPEVLSFVRAARDVADLATKGAAKATSKTDAVPVVLRTDDPNKGRFGGAPRANGRVLTAKVDPVPFSTYLFRVRLAVEAEAGQPPIQGPVEFHLHPSFRDPEPSVPVDADGRAVLEVLAYGAFTVGAVGDAGTTRLELDLAELPDAPPLFRSR